MGVISWVACYVDRKALFTMMCVFLWGCLDVCLHACVCNPHSDHRPLLNTLRQQQLLYWVSSFTLSSLFFPSTHKTYILLPLFSQSFSQPLSIIAMSVSCTIYNSWTIQSTALCIWLTKTTDASSLTSASYSFLDLCSAFILFVKEMGVNIPGISEVYTL